jgi:hypothetical protein
MFKYVYGALASLGVVGLVSFWAVFLGLLIGYLLNIYHLIMAFVAGGDVTFNLRLLGQVIGLFNLIIGGGMGWLV